jgi:hypothetical protein
MSQQIVKQILYTSSPTRIVYSLRVLRVLGLRSLSIGRFTKQLSNNSVTSSFSAASEAFSDYDAKLLYDQRIRKNTKLKSYLVKLVQQIYNFINMLINKHFCLRCLLIDQIYNNYFIKGCGKAKTEYAAIDSVQKKLNTKNRKRKGLNRYAGCFVCRLF